MGALGPGGSRLFPRGDNSEGRTRDTSGARLAGTVQFGSHSLRSAESNDKTV